MKRTNRIFYTCVIMLLNVLYGLGQKKVITPAAFDQWKTVDMQRPGISNDGAYAFYYIDNTSVGSETLVVKATHGPWEMRFPRANEAAFDNGSRMLIFMRADTLCKLLLGKRSEEDIALVENFQLSKDMAGDWLAYQLKAPEKVLILQNLQTGKKISVPNANIMLFDNKVNVALLETTDSNNNNKTSFQWVSLLTDSVKTIWTGSTASYFVFDESGKQFAFMAKDKSEKAAYNEVYYYQLSMLKATKLISPGKNGIDTSLDIGGLLGFTDNGKKLFFQLNKRLHPRKTNPLAVDVNIWAYKDPRLQSVQLQRTNPYEPERDVHTYSMDIVNKSIIRLDQKNEKIIGDFATSPNNTYLLLQKTGGGDLGEEWNWSSSTRSTVEVVNVADGKHKLIDSNLVSPVAEFYMISPCSKYIVHYDPVRTAYLSYSLATGNTTDITMGTHTIWTTFHRDDEPTSTYELMDRLGWMQGDEGFLVSDQNDLYMLDPSGKSEPVNLTNGYGKKHGIVFHLAMEHPQLFKDGEAILLDGFNRKTKEDGFFRITIGKVKDPEKLIFGSYVYRGSKEMEMVDQGPGIFDPVKARDADIYLVRRMSATESPNYFITKDFKTFTPLSDVHPEKDYNWLTSELVTWQLADGSIDQGILYKPENFDSQKKYPLIFHYYERLSDNLNSYIKPEYDGMDFNIPYYVSNGYLVFVPDIHYKTGYPGKSAFEAINSAADYMAAKPWVDQNRMGIEGHSFGGFETDYLVTHTGRFAAACSGSGWADFIHKYNDVHNDDGEPGQFYYEMFRERMGGTLWDKPQLYIENSPILLADKVTTPLLMMNNDKDFDVGFEYGEELFVALRRLGKKVWMLEYVGQGHVLFKEADQRDYNVRTKQFFDYYLMGAPAPKWMVEGIPAYMKGRDSGYESDPGKEP